MNAETVTYVFLGLLAVWSIGWLGYSVYRLRVDGRAPPRSNFWITHLIWSNINLAIAGLSLRSTLQAELFDDDYVRTQRSLVGFNLLLDLVYLAVAYKLVKSKKQSLQESGKAITIQGGFLLVFDLFLVAAYTTTL